MADVEGYKEAAGVYRYAQVFELEDLGMVALQQAGRR